ncbi:MAG: peptide deformylase [Endomicrobiales bacterium]|nr:peptide deformylase [Endomicrobiales bacterium]
MSVLKILKIPDPILKKISSPVGEITPDIQKLASDLVETIRFHKNCVGIAAPQTGKSIRLIVIDVSVYPKPHPNHGLIILINPVITKKEGKRMGREGCLSVPDFTANVTRAEKVAVEGLNEKGKPVKIDASGFESVVLQHEIDHLDGLVFLDRVTSLKTDVFRRKNYVDKNIKKQ